MYIVRVVNRNFKAFRKIFLINMNYLSLFSAPSLEVRSDITENEYLCKYFEIVKLL